MLIVDEIVDTGLTLSWLVNSLGSRNAASVEIATLLRKPEALTMPVEPRYIGWDIPNEFVVGYGLDYREKYRNLRDIGTLAPHVYCVSRTTPPRRLRCDASEQHHQHLRRHGRGSERLGPVAHVVADLGADRWSARRGRRPPPPGRPRR